MTAKSKSSRLWLKEHFSDPYVKMAQRSGYRSRSVFKLLEIQERDRLFKPGMTVIDLGAAPGGWSQVVAKIIQPKGHVIAVDLLPIESIEGVTVIQGDFCDDSVKNAIVEAASVVDWVISDLAPNMSGNPSIDIPRAMNLAEDALSFSLTVLNKKGGLLIKLFQGEGFDIFLKTVKAHFHTVVIRKPKASRGRSRELYLLARGLK